MPRQVKVTFSAAPTSTPGAESAYVLFDGEPRGVIYRDFKRDENQWPLARNGVSLYGAGQSAYDEEKVWCVRTGRPAGPDTPFGETREEAARALLAFLRRNDVLTLISNRPK